MNPRLIYLKVILTFSFFIISNYSFSDSFRELEKKLVNKNPTISELKKWKESEIIKLKNSGKYIHYLNAFYLNHEILLKQKRISNEENINYYFFLRSQSKAFSKYMYYFSCINLVNLIPSNSDKLYILFDLKKFCQKNNRHIELAKTYSEIANNYLKQNQQNKSIYYWIKSAKILKKYPKLNLDLASVYNNIAVAFRSKKSYLNALKYNHKSLVVLKKIKNKSENDISFNMLVYQNRGLYFYFIKDYVNAEIYTKMVYKYILEHPEYHIYFAEPAAILLFINNKTNKKSEQLNIDMTRVYNSIKQDNEVFLRFFIKYNREIKNYKKAFQFCKKLLEISEAENKKKVMEMAFANQLLSREKINEVKAKNSRLLEVQKGKTLINYLIISFITIVSALLFFFKLKNISRDTKIILQAKDLELAKKEALENELKYQKESNINLQLNLEIKKKSEVIFMEKLKEIRRKKNNDPEELIKELQLQIMNMLQIDNKNASKGKLKSKEESEFKTIIKGLNKNLSEQEIRLCAYFKMNLSNKEISQLEQHLAVTSIRVLKNRIKKKLELDPDVKLDDYLNGLC